MSSNETKNQDLDALFSAPRPPPSQLSPQRLPGTDLKALAALLDVLKDNHTRHHIFFNELSFHNHVTHRALAIHALGGPAEVLRDYYKRDSEIQRSAFESPEPITEANFADHVGDERFYQAYVSFFSEQVSQKGAVATLEEFVFSEKYNFREGSDEKTHPRMLARFYAGLLHPMIHAGYGVEFGVKGMLVEGLALTAVHKERIKGSFPPSLFAPVSTSVDHVATRLSSLALETQASPIASVTSKTAGVHVFDILARILKDDRLKSVTLEEYDRYAETMEKLTPILMEHADQWTVSLERPGEVERKMEEVIWLSSLLYGVGGLTPNSFRSDFFLMHQVTSSLFLPSLIAYLSPRAQVLLMRGYLFTVLGWWIMRGRPALNIKSFMTTTSVHPSVPATPVAKGPLTIETTPTPNPFLPVLQSAITHPNDHVVKIQRAFAHFDTLYGTRPAGYFKGTELEGAELLDGSLFLRAALLTADYVGWVREGEEARQFSFEGFYA